MFGIGVILPTSLCTAQETQKPIEEKNPLQTPAKSRPEKDEKAGKGSSRRFLTEITAIAKDRESLERFEAIEKLGDMESSQSLEDLTSILQEDADVEARSRSALSLGGLADPGSIAPLGEALLHDPEISVRVSAAQALGMIGLDSGEESLLLAVDSGQAIVVRIEAIRALGSVHTRKSTDALTAALKDESAEVRLAALESLARRGNPEAAGAVRELVNDKNAVVAEKACWTLGELRDKSSLPLLTTTLRTGATNQIRLQSALALGRIGDPESLEALSASALAETEDLTVRVAAVKALGMLDSMRAGDPLVRLLKHHEAILRSAAAYALCSLPSPEAATGVRGLVFDADARARASAMEAMGLWPEHFLSTLVTVAHDRAQDTRIRLLALVALGDLPAQKLGELELNRLLDPKDSVEVQIGAIRLLEIADTPSARFALREFEKVGALDPRVQEVLEQLWTSPPFCEYEIVESSCTADWLQIGKHICLHSGETDICKDARSWDMIDLPPDAKPNPQTDLACSINVRGVTSEPRPKCQDPSWIPSEFVLPLRKP